MPAGVEVEGARLAHQLHAGFDWHLIALTPIARMAAGHQVLPGGRTATRPGYHVIEREFARRQNHCAVLAGIAVA